VDDLIKRYAAVLQEIYDNRTAGDSTFSGVLAEFVSAAQYQKQDEEDAAWDEHHKRMADAYDKYMQETQEGEYERMG
jgi:hypothetical protein